MVGNIGFFRKSFDKPVGAVGGNTA